MSLAKYLEKFRHFRQAYVQAGGFKATYLQFYRTEELKYGDLIGVDKYGNKYYENKSYMLGRSRWVYYTDAVGMDYDGSQIPAEWHKWLHYVTDDTPTKAPPPNYKWIADHKENLTGTKDEYVPYSTTKPKIESWKPPQKTA